MTQEHGLEEKMSAQKYCPRCYGKLIGDGFRDRSGIEPNTYCSEECADVSHGRTEGQPLKPIDAYFDERRENLERAREIDGRLDEP